VIFGPGRPPVSLSPARSLAKFLSDVLALLIYPGAVALFGRSGLFVGVYSVGRPLLHRTRFCIPKVSALDSHSLKLSLYARHPRPCLAGWVLLSAWNSLVLFREGPRAYVLRPAGDPRLYLAHARIFHLPHCSPGALKGLRLGHLESPECSVAVSSRRFGLMRSALRMRVRHHRPRRPRQRRQSSSDMARSWTFLGLRLNLPFPLGL